MLHCGLRSGCIMIGQARACAPSRIPFDTGATTDEYQRSGPIFEHCTHSILEAQRALGRHTTVGRLRERKKGDEGVDSRHVMVG